MPYTLKVEGMDEITAMLADVEESAQGIAALALYEGAGIIADAINKGARGLRTAPFKYAAGERKRKPSPEEKAILQNAKKGVAKFRKTGVSVQTSVGLQNSGYAELAGKTVPIPLIANAINSGTSFRKKQPFFRKAESKSGAAEAAIENKLREQLESLSAE